MKIDVLPVPFEQKPVLRRLMELYLYEFSAMQDKEISEYGEYGYHYFDHYWTDSNRFPFLIRANGKIAGFALVLRSSLFSDQESSLSSRTTAMAEFFVLLKYRRKGVGAEAAALLFDRFPGRWEVGEIEENPAAHAFWRRIIGDYTNGNYEEVHLQTEHWQGPCQIFEAVPRGNRLGAG
ncbi:MAG TPA: GNAT family N-acetyltransferase [Anaerolineaceae bacterium]